MTISSLVTSVTEENVTKKVRSRQARETVELLNRASRDDAIWFQDVLNRESTVRGVRVRLLHDGMLAAEWNRFVQ